MLNLTENQPGNHHFIREVHEGRLVINDRSFSSSVVVGARLLEDQWPVRSLSELTKDSAEPILTLEPELVVIGIGSKPIFPDASLQQLFFSRGIGLECMTLKAAARTFNILMSENRRALAALIL
ncbi:MAG TPA: MTH938/NDUFAF3 family protein [Wenzhouxiangella sp.]|nr:MTH938/NDUFAF3 family protein [Wenzhouxiangella sp.]